MNELRTDRLTGRNVIIVPGRATRPVTSPDRTVGATSSGTADIAKCPFCVGNEATTPPEVFRTGSGDPDTPGWRVRIVPNLYPIVDETKVSPIAQGCHEVAVLSPNHGTDFGGLSDLEANEVLLSLRARTIFHRDSGRAHTQLFINQGRTAGASIAHPHAQLVTLDAVPPMVEEELQRFANSPDNILRQDFEASSGAGAEVLTVGQVQAWCPLGSTSSYVVRIAEIDSEVTPTVGIEDASDELLNEMAIALRDVLFMLTKTLNEPDYNVVFHNAPTSDKLRENYQWWIEVIPRISVLGGFELGSGIYVNTVEPVVAAKTLADAI